ncbi:MAG: hypothetical protein DRJ03_12040 [Chloroflexi bacterium]|nr:MAG: hypothetical protein DRJ03_12040 [Chloroflexota bacterium]
MFEDDTPVHLVVCREDRKDDDTRGDYVFASKAVFTDIKSAEKYHDTVHPTRDPLIIKVTGMYAQTLRMLRKMALRDIRRHHEEANVETKNLSDSAEQEERQTP